MSHRLVLLLSTLAIAASQPATADDIDCPPNLGAVTIDGNVLVAAECDLDGTTVKGNVFVYAGGTLNAREADIIGNIQAEDAVDVNVFNSRIGGSIQLDRLVGDASTIADNAIDGSIQLVANRTSLDVDNNAVGADVQAFDNTGGIDVSGNTIDGNLQCKENQPPPSGGNNEVQGNAEDQCESLTASKGGGGSGGGGTGSGGDEDCVGAIGAVTIDGNLQIAAACELDGTTIKGNVLLYAGGSLTANGIDVIGNIQADNAFEIDVADSRIEGSIQFDNLVGAASITANDVIGNIQLNDNGFALSVIDNVVGADVQAFSNSGGIDITDNTVDGNLQCKDNDPAPTGGGNVVGGNKEDQCANLQAASGSSGGSAGSQSAGSASASNNLAGSGSGGGATGAVLLAGLLLLRTFRRRLIVTS